MSGRHIREAGPTLPREEPDWLDAQEDVIAHTDGPLQVVACAGSGKTSTISRRIARLVGEGVDKNAIVAFTFTENAADELKVNIREAMEWEAGIESETLGDMFVGTIHQFCIDLLHDLDPSTLDYDVLDENEVAAFLYEHFFDLGLDDLRPRHPEERMTKVRWFIEDIQTLRRELIVGEARESEDEDTERLMRVYDNYRALMEDYHFFDYQELIYRAVKTLEENPDALDAARSALEHLVVDEYQDINRAQERLIQLLVGGEDQPNLCGVGDDDQSIYGWRGARPENFLTFEDRYGAETETMGHNFRSTDLIVDIAEGVIENNTRRLDKEMEAGREADIGDVYQYYFDQEEDEVEWMADKIEELLGTVYEDPQGNLRTLGPEGFAVLVRRKRDMDAIQHELEERDLPYTIRGQQTFFGRPESNFIRLAFAYLARGQDDDLEIIDVESSDDPTHTEAEVVTHRVTEATLRGVIQESHHLADREDEIIECLNERKAWFADPTARRIFPQDEFQNILRCMGVAETTPEDRDDPFPEPIMYELGRVSKLVEEFETVYEMVFPDQIVELVEFLDYAHFHGRSEQEDPTLVEAVNIMTIHAAKGKEFPAVFVPGLTTTKFPNHPPMPRGYRRPLEWLDGDVFDYNEYEPDAEDMRRLFYVALTRAQKYLFLTGAEDNIGYNQNQNPSPYYEDVSDLGEPRIMTNPDPDPTPRERRDIDVPGEGWVYPTSFSDLRYYQKCPYDYKLRKVFGFSPNIDPAFGYGFAVHDVLREMHGRFEEDAVSIPPTPGEIEEIVQDPDRFHLRYASGDIEDNLRDAAEDILTDYVADFQEEIPMTYRAEVPFEHLIGGEDDEGSALVSGTIDLLEKRDPETNEVTEVDVVDFKTAEEPEYEYDPDLRDARFQVQLYGLAAREELDLEAIEGFIHWLQEGTRTDVSLEDLDLARIEELVEQQVQSIMERDFHATPGKEVCEPCDFSDICPYSAI